MTPLNELLLTTNGKENYFTTTCRGWTFILGTTNSVESHFFYSRTGDEPVLVVDTFLLCPTASGLNGK